MIKIRQRKELYAKFDQQTIRVYQAYRDNIADEAVRLNKFGENFSFNRMTWIKPSFLWMMYRSNWALKKKQKRILAIDLLRRGFDLYLEQAVLTTDDSMIFQLYEEWDNEFNNSDVYCQWDPDRDIWGKAIGRSAIQIGIKGQASKDYVNKWIVRITDLTSDVNKWRDQIKNGRFNKKVLPKEKVYPVSLMIRKRLDMD